MNGLFRCHDYEFRFAGDPCFVQGLEALFVDLATEHASSPHRFEIELFHAHARVVVDQTNVGDWVLHEFLAANVISTLTVAVIESDPTTLHLHAGAVVADEATVLLVSPSGSGKSTLTCALVMAGAEYRTDEVVAVQPGGNGVITYPKPLSIKAAGKETVARLTGITPPETTVWEIPASTIGTLARAQHAPVRTVVFNSFAPSRPVRIHPVHRATAVRRMLSDSQDAVALGPDSLATAAALVRSARCISVTGGAAADVATAILDVHASGIAPGTIDEVPAPTSLGAPSRSPDVRSLVIDGRAVVYTVEPATIIELDEAQTAWWLLLDGTSLDQIVDEVASEIGWSRADAAAVGASYLGTFRSLGIITEPCTIAVS